MEWFFGLWGIYFLAECGLLAADFWENYLRQRARLQAFRDTVELCGLQVVKISTPGSRMKIEAQADPVAVRVEDIRDRKREYSIRVVVAFPGPPGFAGVRIRREADKPPGAREVEVGDDLFDSAFYVEGPTRLLSVLLDAETRLQLANVNAKGRLLIAGGELQVETSDPHFANILSLLLQIARRFMEEVNVAQRLAENARQDPVPGVRLGNLLVLVREFPGEPGILEILRAACADQSPAVRLRAAMALGAEGREVLLDVAESLKDDESSAQAKAIGASGDAAAVDALTNVLAAESELATAAALALGAIGSPAAEPPLLRALRRPSLNLRVAAATALGRVGTAAAVLPLKEAAERAPEDKDLHRATRQAIAEIQSRLQSASPGQLSLAGTEGGQLSLAQTEGGQLSMATDPAGQLSLAPDEPGGGST